MTQTKPARNVVGRILSRVRSEKGWSQETLTAKCQLAGWDISRGIIVSIEGGLRKVEDWQILILAKALEVHPGKLFPERFDLADLPMPPEETQRIRREMMDNVRWNKAKEEGTDSRAIHAATYTNEKKNTTTSHALILEKKKERIKASIGKKVIAKKSSSPLADN